MEPLDATLAGSCNTGYDDAAMNQLCNQLSTHLPTDVWIACVWEHPDDGFGMHGHSQMHLIDQTGQMFHISDHLWCWLAEIPGTPDAPTAPGAPDSWAGEPAALTLDELDPGVGDYNYSRRA